MPNWCINNISIKGDIDNMKPMVDKLETINKKGLLDTFYPLPTELENTTKPPRELSEQESEELIKKYGFNNWYDWRVYNYGTKWSDDETNISKDDDTELSGYFNTAWSPPEMGIRYISKRFKNNTFEVDYFEPGMDYMGSFKYLNGICHNEIYIDEMSRLIREHINLPEDTDDEYYESDEWYDTQWEKQLETLEHIKNEIYKEKNAKTKNNND
tara:strand:- start:11566 stop:12204 length:639 start_codon:yes stop_codon:yes gene_type:complete